MQFFRQKNGAISIFLVIILVPCMMVSSLFVDIGRVHLSKGMANSSADLALNTLMTRYDADLKEFYGLAASCQSIDEFYSMSVDYFERTMTSQGLTEEEADLMVDEFKLAFTDLASRNPSDLLDVEVVDATVSSALDTSNMANPTLIKDGIIEFMKYRAPIGIAERGILTLLGGSKQQLENEKEENELRKKKDTYYESAKDFYTTAQTIYFALKNYTAQGYTEEKINGLLTTINGYKDTYKEIHKALVFDLMNTEGLVSINRPKYNDTNDSFKVYTYPGEAYWDENGIMQQKLATEDDIKNLINQLILAISNFNTAKQTLENSFIEYKGSTEADPYYDIQYWVKGGKAIQTSLASFDQSMKALMTARNALKNAEEYLYVEDYYNIFEKENPTKWRISDGQYSVYDKFSQDLSTKEHYNSVIAQYDSIYNTYICTIDINENSTDKYVKYISILERISNDDANRAKLSASTNILSNGKSVETTITDIKTEIGNIRQGFVDRKEELEAINGLLDILEGYRSARKTNFDSWESAADNLDEKSEMAEEDMAAINEGQPEKNIKPEKDVVDEVTADDIKNMKTRISGMIGLYDTLIDIIDTQKYGGAEIRFLTSVDGVKTVSGIDKTELNKNQYLSISSLNQYVNDTFSYTGDEPKVDYTDENHPSISHSPIPALYDWMLLKGWDAEIVNKAICSKCNKEFDSTCYDEAIAREQELEQIKQDAATESGANSEDIKTADKIDKSVCPECQYGNTEGYDEDADAGDPENAPAPDDDGKETGDIKKDKEANKSEVPFPSDFSTGGISLIDNFEGLLGTIGDLFTDTGETLESARDALYTTEYIFGMFSHQAYEEEAKYQIMLDNAGKEGIPARTTLTTLGPISIKSHFNNEKVKEIYNSDDPEITYNKSLTNNKICGENNYAYGAEIEYILKADTNSKNYTNIYGNIYAIRYLTNIPAGFTTFWKIPSASSDKDEDKNHNMPELIAKATLYQSVSTAVSTATYGIIPAPLVKGVLILVEVAVETVLDMEYLKAGLPVKFIKGKCDENWGFTRTIEIEDKKNKKGEIVGAKVKLGYTFYSDYLYVFMITGLLNEDSLDGIYKRIGDVVQANMQKITSYDKYQLCKAITHFKFTATLKVNSLMIDLPIFNGIDNQLDTKDDWCTYDVDIVRGY